MTVCVGPRSHPPRGNDGHPDRFTTGHVKARPTASLARHVDHYWISRWDRRGVAAKSAVAILDPCVHVHIRDGRAEVLGVVRGTYRTMLDGVGCVVGVKFRPGGFYPFVRQPVSRWTDTSVSLADVVHGGEEAASCARIVWDAIRACDGNSHAHASLIAAHLDELLTALEPTNDSTAEEMASLVALVGARPDVRHVGDLVRESGRSERTLHRLFLRYVGVSPAWVIRRYRLHAAAERLAACATTDLQGLAYELGYADQAHFIRDFRTTIGVTPGAYVGARMREVEAVGVERRVTIGGRLP